MPGISIPARLPRPAPEGAHVRVISPAWPMVFRAPDRVRIADAVLGELGFRVSYGEYAATVTDGGTAAGTPAQRASDLQVGLIDPDVDVVLSAFGGESTHELLPHLDATVLRRSTTPFVGSSDNVWINHYLYQEVGLVSYYGVAHTGEFFNPIPETLEYFQRAVMSGDDLVCQPMPWRTNRYDERPPRLDVPGGWNWLRRGYARGPLLGAELSLLVRMVEYFDMTLDGAVVFWDIGPLNSQQPEDLLARLADLVDLSRLAGMLVGPDVRYLPDKWAAVVGEALDSLVPTARYPVVVNADVGHLDPKWVVPYGNEAIVDPDRGVVFPRRRG